MNKKIAVLVAVLLILGIGFYAYNTRESGQVTEDTGSRQQPETSISDQAVNQGVNAATTSPAPTPAPPKAQTQNTDQGTKYITGQYSGGGDESAGPDIQVVEVAFDGSKFTPSSVTINSNDWVFFKNNSTGEFWPASAPHPSHTNYPEFDAKQAVATGKSWKFQFTKTGTWKYHDHLNPSAYGTIVVK